MSATLILSRKEELAVSFSVWKSDVTMFEHIAPGYRTYKTRTFVAISDLCLTQSQIFNLNWIVLSEADIAWVMSVVLNAIEPMQLR